MSFFGVDRRHDFIARCFRLEVIETACLFRSRILRIYIQDLEFVRCEVFDYIIGRYIIAIG